MDFKGSEITSYNIFDVIKYTLDVTHKEKGGTYNVIMVLKSKDRTDGVWYLSVLYRNISGDYFVRSLDDFCKKFKVREAREEMITKEEFTKLISNQKNWDARLDAVGKTLNCNPLDMDWIEYGARLFDNTINLLFKEDGVDIINWWLFERSISPIKPKMWDEKGDEIPVETIDDLWNVVKDFRK